jgi:hypothetical protein
LAFVDNLGSDRAVNECNGLISTIDRRNREGIAYHYCVMKPFFLLIVVAVSVVCLNACSTTTGYPQAALVGQYRRRMEATVQGVGSKARHSNSEPALPRNSVTFQKRIVQSSQIMSVAALTL